MKMKKLACFAAVLTVVGVGVFFAFDDAKSGPDVGSARVSKLIAAARPVRATSALGGVGAYAVPTNQTVTVRGTKPYVLASERPFAKSLRLAAESLGARTVGVLSAKALLIEATPEACARIRADGRFAGVSEFVPSRKLAPGLAAAVAAGEDPLEVSFVTLSPADRQAVQGRVMAAGGEILQGCLNEEDVFSARLSPAQVVACAASGDVRWMELFVRPHLMNDKAVNPEAMNVRPVWTAHELDGRNLNGEGQVVSTSDSGIDTGDLETLHEDLREHVLEMKAAKTSDGKPCDMFDSNGHGTHTAGSIVGDGTLSQDGEEFPDGPIRGTAWGAKLYVWFCGKDGSRSVYTPESCAELFRGDTASAAWADAYIHSASWGSDTAGEYNAQCAKFDSYLWTHPDFLPVVSAGNAGSDRQTVGSPAASKNVLTVGATLNLSEGDPAKTATFSSRGPCADGRIKPDVSAPGDAVTSTRSTKTEGEGPYTSMSGTSMSCPLTAGSVAIVRQWLVERRGFDDPALPPSAALMKAVITGGAKGTPLPGIDQGWGRVDLEETLFPTNGRAVALVDRIPFAEAETYSWVVETTNDAPLEVQLAWVDYPGSANDSSDMARLVNDLDLTVEAVDDADGEIHYGNGGKVPDRLNNLESVRLAGAKAAKYRITVTCSNVLYDYEDGGAAALYVRGAFDPETITSDLDRVRLVSASGEEIGTYAMLDAALAQVTGDETVEILAPAKLHRSCTVWTNVTIVATNAIAAETPIRRMHVVDQGPLAELVVTNGVLTLSNVVFQSEATTPVRVKAPGRVRVAGTVALTDLSAGVPGIETDAPSCFELFGPLENGLVVDCSAATENDTQFGAYACDDEVARASARLLISPGGADRAGDARTPAPGSARGFLFWQDGAAVDPRVAVAYVDGLGVGANAYYRSLDPLFDDYPQGTNVVITRSGGVLRTPRVFGGDYSISTTGNEAIVSVEADAAFRVTNGTLTVSGLTFEGFSGDGLLIAEGTNAALSVVNAVFRDIEGTNRHSGAVASLRGAKVTVDGGVFDGCRASGKWFVYTGIGKRQGTVPSNGGAISVDCGGTLELVGTNAPVVVANCSAAGKGGGIYVDATESLPSTLSAVGDVTVRGNRSNGSSANEHADDIYLVEFKGEECVKFTVTGDLTAGEKTIGLSRGACGAVFAAFEDGALEDPAATKKVFFRDESATLFADIDYENSTFFWSETPDNRVPQEQAVCELSGCGEGADGFYGLVKDAVAAIDADATLTVFKDAVFDADLVFSNRVTVVCTNDGGIALSRLNSALVQVVPGGELTLTNVSVNGSMGANGANGLFKVSGGTLTLQAGVTVSGAEGWEDRASGAISVWNGGTFVMESGATIADCGNDYMDYGDGSGYGGALLVEDVSVAYLKGGEISGCWAHSAGGVFIGSEAALYLSGDATVTGNFNLYGNDDNLSVDDGQLLILTGDGAFTGKVGYNEGYQADTNVFGRVDAAFGGDAQAAAHRFTHDFTGDVGMAVTDGNETLLVWSSALNEEGKYTDEDGNEYELSDGEKVEISVPVLTPTFTYDGLEKTAAEAGLGYEISGNVATNVGTYTAVAVLRPGFVWADVDQPEADWSADWTIVRARYDMSGMVFTNETYEWDGFTHYLVATGLPEGVTVAYVNNGQSAVGVHQVTAKFSSDDGNYEAPDPAELTATLTITGDVPPPTPPPGPGPTVITNSPFDIAFQSITRVDETTWALVVTNRRQLCWYRLIQTDDLAKGFTTTGAWEQATEDGPWVTNVIIEAAEPKSTYFWRAEGTWGTDEIPPVPPDVRPSGE